MLDKLALVVTVLLVGYGGLVAGRALEGAPVDWGFLLSGAAAATVVYVVAFTRRKGRAPH